MVASILLAMLPGLAQAEAPRVVAMRVTDAPRIDGKLNERVWRDAFVAQDFGLLGSGAPATQATVARVLYDSRNFYIGFECAEDRSDAITAVVDARDGPVQVDDCVELFVAPGPDPNVYYHFMVNARGALRDALGPDERWNSGAVAAAELTDQGWSAEIAVPVADLELTAFVGSEWYANFCREERPHGELTSWAPCQSGFHEPGRFGKLTGVDIDVAPHARAGLKRRLEAATAQLRLALQRARAAQPLSAAITAFRAGVEIQEELRRVATLTNQRGAGFKELQEAETTLQEGLTGLAALRIVLPRLDMSLALRRAGKPTGYAVCQESPMTRVRPREPYEGVPANAVGISLAAREYEAAQIVVAPIEKNLAGVRLEVTDLHGRAGKLIPRSEIAIKAVGTVSIREPSNRSGALPGEYPDPLLPNQPRRIDRQEVASWLVTVHAPAGQAPGVYSGRLTVEAENAPRQVLPLRVTVWGFELPRTPALRTCFQLVPSYLWKVYGLLPAPLGEPQANVGHDSGFEQRAKLLRAYRLDSLEHRCSDMNIASPRVEVSESGEVRINWSEFDWEIEFYVEHGLNAFNVYWTRVPGGWGSVAEVDEKARRVSAEILRQTQQHLAEKGWLDLAYLYAIDEPGKDAFPQVEAAFDHVHRAAPRLKRLLTLGYGASRPTEPGNPLYRRLEGYVDIWVPHSDCFEPRFLEQRRRAGDEIWEYVCISAQKPYANICGIDTPGTDPRVVFWQCFAEEITGFLYWATNYWEKDPWQDSLTYPGGNGEGSLFYYGPDGPVSSLRWETIRDGIEDYDYLALLNSLVRQAEQGRRSPALCREARKLLEVSDVTRSYVDYTTSPKVIERHREAVARMIERLSGR